MAAILNHSHSWNLTSWTQTNLHKTLTQTYSFSLNLMMAAILNSAILNLVIAMLDLDYLSFLLSNSLKNTLTQDLVPTQTCIQKNLQTSFILTQLDVGSHLEFYHVGLRKLHSFILTQTWLKNSLILKLAILELSLFCTKLWLKLTHSDSTWWWQPTWILPSWILPSWIQLSDCTQKHSHSTLTQTQTNSIWLKLIHSH